MGWPFYEIEGSTFRSAFFGFAFEFPGGWRLANARAAGATAIVWLGPVGGNVGQLEITIFARDDAKMARYVDDPAAARERYPGTARFPFGEARTAPIFRRGLLFARNDVIFQIIEREGPPEVLDAVEAILRSLRFFTPSATSVPPQLRTFRYLHPGSKKAAPSDPDMTRLELEARLAHSLGHEQIFVGAVICVQLGRHGEARELFRRASAQIEENAGGDLHAFVSAVEAALLAGDEESAVRLGRMTPARPDVRALSADRALYARALGLLAAGEDDACREELRGAKGVERWMPGIGRLVEAVLERDADPYADALNAVLDAHHRKARTRGSQIWNSPVSWICVPASALAMVGRRRGLSVPENLRARRATLKGLLVISAQQRPDGSPVLPATTFDLDVDYLAVLAG